MAAMHDDVWDEAPDRQPDQWDRKVQAAIAERDQAAGSGRVPAYLERRVRAAVAEREHHATRNGEKGAWRLDDLDRRAHAIIAYRNRIAASVDGPVPAYGTREWAAADPQTQAAAAARHERDVAAAQGEAISNRMAADTAERRDAVESSHAISAEMKARPVRPLRRDVSAQRDADQKRRDAMPKPWEAGYAASLGAPVPAPRASRECLQPDSSLEAAADEARRAAQEACAAPDEPRHHARSSAVTDVNVRV